jgi:class 3 adenylate cyclase
LLRSLQVKFSALIVTLLVVACVALAWLSTQHEERALEAEVARRAQALARALAGTVKEPLVVRDDLTVGTRVNQLGTEPGVAAARVIDADGSVMAALADSEVGESRILLSGRGVAPATASLLRRTGTRVLVATPIYYSDLLVGEAQVELDLGVLVVPKVQEGARQLAAVAVAVAVLGVVAGLVFVSLLVGPIRRLRSGVERLTHGDLTVSVPPTSSDEIGDLTRAFNDMGESLRQKERIQSAFGRYVSDYVLTHLLESPEDLTGVEREVTVLFADVRRFTRLSEGMKARDVVALLNDFFELVASQILSQEGTIDKFIGDSVMAYFGAPIPQSDHAQRAVWAAVEVQRSIAQRNRHADAGGIELGVGIGIHTGHVVVGNIGSERRSDFTAIGDAVNVASRLEKLARPGEILISEAVQRQVRGALPLRFEGERQLSGRLEPVHVYSVDMLGASDAPIRARSTSA